jgi:multicomponent Na+:H+ antiporter subunit A
MVTIEIFLIAGLILAALAQPIGRRLGSSFGLLASLVPLSAFVWGITSLQTLPIISSRPWVPSLGLDFSLRLDHLGLLFWLLISGIGTLIFIYAGAYMKPKELPRLLSILSVFMVAMLGIASAANAITLFLFWEITSITSFLLIGFKGEYENSRKSAVQALAVTGIGGLILLAGLILLGTENHTFEFAQWTSASPIAITLVAIGCMTKSAQFPFHFWLPNAMAAPTPVSAYLHSATMVKAGIFLLAKLSPLFGPQPALAWIGAITLVWASVLSLGERDLKRILAWSTVGALGLMVMLIGHGTKEAAEAVAYTILAHALYKGALFMTAGSIDYAMGTRDALQLGNLRRHIPTLALPAILASLSLAGIPIFAGFIKKELALAAFEPATGIPFLIAIIISAISGIIVAMTLTHRIFFQSQPEEAELHHAPTPGLWIPPLILAVLGLLVGAFCLPIGEHFIQYVAATIHGSEVKNHIALWHGFKLPLFLSIGAIVTGFILNPFWPRIRTSLENLPKTVTLEGSFRALNQLTNQTSVGITMFYERRSVRDHMILNFGAFLVILGVVAAQNPMILALPNGPGILFHEVVLLLFAALAAIVVIFIPNRLGAVAVLGIVGVAMAITYVTFSAPDLALTQILIDVLTVVLFVLIFAKLPRFKDILTKNQKLTNATISIVFGSAMTLLMLAVLSAPQLPSINHYFAETSYTLGQGLNVVNVIIVDYRALDTMGEITVLCLAALGVHTLLRLKVKSGGQKQ